jgi:hypothetical protein
MARKITILGMGPTAAERRIDIARYCEGTEVWCLNNGYLPYAHLVRAGGVARWYELHKWDYLKTWDAGSGVDHFAALDSIGVDVWVTNPLPVVRRQRVYPVMDICRHMGTNYFLGSPSLMLMHALYEHDKGEQVQEVRAWGIDTSDPQHGQQRQSWAFWISQAMQRGISFSGTATDFFAEAEKDDGLRGLRESVGSALQREIEEKAKAQKQETPAIGQG